MSAGLIFALSLIFSAPAYPVVPGLPLPEWIDVGLSLSEVPEMGRTFAVTATVQVMIGKLEEGKYSFHLPEGVELVGGAPEGRLALAAGQDRSLRIQARVARPTRDASITFELLAAYPREALHARIDEVHAGKAAEDVGTLHRYLDGLVGEHRFPAMIPISVIPEEGFGPMEGPGFLSYYQPAGANGARLALLEGGAANAGADEADPARVRDLFERNPKLAELFRKAGKNPEMLVADSAMALYSRAVADLEAGKQASAAEAFADLASKQDPATLAGFAAMNARAVTLFAMGRAEEARALWTELTGQEGSRDNLARYAHFNLGEALRSEGKASEAAGHYRRALELKPAYTLARQRLELK